MIFRETFADFHAGNGSDLDDLMRKRGWILSGKHFDPRPLSFTDEGNGTIILDADPEDTRFMPLYPGAHHVKTSIIPPFNNGWSMLWPFYANLGPIWTQQTHPEEPDEIYQRFYFMLGDWTPQPMGGKFLCGVRGTYNRMNGKQTAIDPIPPGGPYALTKPNAPVYAGNSTKRSYTCSGWSRRNEFKAYPVSPLATPLDPSRRRIACQPCDWWSVEGGYIDGRTLEFNALADVEPWVWHEMQVHTKLNSIDTSGATVMWVGYPWGGLYSNPSNTKPFPSMCPKVGLVEREAQCMADGAPDRIVLDAADTRKDQWWINYSVHVASRPDEIRRIVRFDAATKTAWIAAHKSSPATWNTIPRAGETFRLIANTELRPKSRLRYGNKSGRIYGDDAIPCDNANVGALMMYDTAILESDGIGRRDGVHQVWIDGQLALDLHDVRTRSLPNIQIEGLWWIFFMGGSSPVPESRMDLYFTEIAADTSYIPSIGADTPMPDDYVFNVEGKDYELVPDPQATGDAAVTVSGTTYRVQEIVVDPPDPPPTSGLPAWFTALAPMTWHEIPGTKIKGDYTPTHIYPPTQGSYDQIVNAWAGMCLRREGATIIFLASGGHSNYGGNQVLKLALQAEFPQWEEHDPGSDPSALMPDSAYYADGRATSTHGYNHIHFIDTEDRAVRVVQAGMYGSGAPSLQGVSFDWQSKTWAAPGTMPDIVLGSQPINVGTCKHPTTEDIYTLKGAALKKWDRASNAYVTLAGNLKDQNNAGLNQAWQPVSIDHDRGEIVSPKGDASGSIYVINLATLAVQRITPTGEVAALQSTGLYSRLFYSTRLQRHLFMRSTSAGLADRIYQIVPGTWEVSEFPIAGVCPVAVAGVNSRLHEVPDMNALVYVPSATENVRIVRL